ncbi:MAG: imelysin family protein [Devosia sp.]
MRLALAFVLALLSFSAFAQESATTPDPVMQSAVDGVIRPAVIGFAREASGLASTLELLCAAPSESALDIAEGQFRQTALAYGRIELLRLGPLMEENRAERLLFWPDRRGIALRQVQAVLADEDETATDPATLSDKSAALQGLVALEYVLFGSDAVVLAEPGGNFRCRFGLAIAQGIAGMGQELATGWYRPDGVAQHLMLPRSGNADYRTQLEALEALVGLLSHGLEAVRDTRINPFIAKDGSKPNPKLALFWRSGLTVEMLRANMHGLRDLFTVSGVGLKDPGLANSIEFEFSNADRALELVTLPLEEAVADVSQAHALDYLVIVTGSLQAMIGEQLSAALGLSVGFSSLDGD